MTQGREYSDDTARLIDEEIARILHEQEHRAFELLTKHRSGLDLVAEALLEQGDHRRRRGRPASCRRACRPGPSATAPGSGHLRPAQLRTDEPARLAGPAASWGRKVVSKIFVLGDRRASSADRGTFSPGLTRGERSSGRSIANVGAVVEQGR